MSRPIGDEPNELGAVGYYDKTIGVNDTVGFFAISKAVQIPPKDVAEGEEARCDRGKLGPSSLHVWNEATNICSCGSLEKPDKVTGDHLIAMSDLIACYPVFEALPYGIILYIELKDPQKEEEAIRLPNHTRTLQEMLRYIVEWDWAYDVLGNREEIAVLCNGIMSTIQTPDNVKEWVIDQVPPEKVGRFLQGHPDARARTAEPIPELPDFVSNWMHDLILRCRTFGEYEKERTL